MRLIVEDPTPEFREDLLALLANHHTHVEVHVDNTWTLERAEKYWNILPPRAQKIVREAVLHMGTVPASLLREDGKGLRGHSGPLRTALERGIRLGWWPDTIQPPIEAQGPGFGQVAGYTMPADLIEVFEEAIVDATQQAALTEAIDSEGGTWDADRAMKAFHSASQHHVDKKRTRAVLRRIAATGFIVKTDPDRAVYRLTDES
ncbi:hypothetical protein ACIGZJ_30710 [Kitasatospora sp. NPDC052868]|uniref:hypothetical protein n=1 Tax=Kitasatospora sp. NPDC052868 TaxID=3364060 RepID=UPI0037C5584B